MKPLCLIIVEDSEDDTFLMLWELKKGGYDPDYVRVEDAVALEAALQKKNWDLVISDHSLPSFSAPEALDILKNSGRDLPFIIVSSVIGEDVAVSAMKAGAHDYIMKNNLPRLVPVVERVLCDAEVRSDRKKVREALIESEARYRRIIENARDLVYRIRLHPELAIEFLSPSIEKLIGFPAEYFYENAEKGFARIYYEDRHLLEGAIKGEISFSKPLLTRWVHRDGSIRWIEQSIVPFYDQSGSLIVLDGIARDITERINSEQELKKSHAQIEALSNRILTAMEEERSRLARELHDELGQALTAVKLDLQMLDESISSAKPVNSELEKSIELIDYTIDMVRRQSVSLRPPALDDLGLLSCLEEMLRGFMARTKIKTTLNVKGLKTRLPKQFETAIYRCVQESLTNIARHSKANNAVVEFKKENGLIYISVRDDGVGFEPEIVETCREHIGLAGMQERVKLLAGKLEIDSAPSKGTAVLIEIPWEKNISMEVSK